MSIFSPYNPMEVDAEYLMDHPEEREAMHARIEKASSEIISLLVSKDTPTKIKKICDQYALIETQIVPLVRMIRNIVIGNMYFGDIIQEIQKLDIPELKARQIANSIVDELFQPAMEDIKKIQMENFKDRLQAKPVAGNVINLREKH